MTALKTGSDYSRRRLGACALALLLAAAAAEASDKLVIKGSDTLGAKMVPQIAETFKADGHDVTFEIAAEGSSTGVKAIITGTANLGMSSRDIKEEELAQAREQGVEIRTITVAKDAIALIVNEANPIGELRTDQIRLIFTGVVRNWAAFGGRPGDISAYTRNTASGTYKVFQKLAMDDEDYSVLAQKMAGNEQIAAEVATNRNGIGYVGLAYVDTPGVKVVKVDGFMPTPRNVVNGSYPLARPLYYLTDGEPRGMTRKFVEYSLGATGQRIAAEVHFVPVAAELSGS